MLGTELRNARKAAGFSQEKLAERAGIHPTYISMLENDKKSPTINILLRICDALGVKASEIIARIEKDA